MGVKDSDGGNTEYYCMHVVRYLESTVGLTFGSMCA